MEISKESIVSLNKVTPPPPDYWLFTGTYCFIVFLDPASVKMRNNRGTATSSEWCENYMSTDWSLYMDMYLNLHACIYIFIL